VTRVRSNDLAARIGRWAETFQPTTAQRTRVEASLRDYASCVLAGLRRAELAPALAIAARGETRVWGRAERLAPSGAALVYGTAGSLLQLHDVYLPAVLHPSSPVISAALAVASAGSDLVGAVAAGYEACNRVGTACSPEQVLGGSAPTGTAGAVGAAVAAARLRGADAEGIGRAVGAVAMLMPVAPFAPMCAHGALVPLHPGLAARAGVEAVDVAAHGAAGDGALDGFGTLPGLVSFLRGRPADLRPEAWDGGTLHELIWKYAPACFAAHPALEALATFERSVLDDFDELEVRLAARLLPLVAQGPTLGDLYDRLMSLRWLVVRALLAGEGPYDWRDLERPMRFADELAQAARVRIVHGPELDGLDRSIIAARIVLKRRDGTTTEATRRRGMTDREDDAATWTVDPASTRLRAKWRALSGTDEAAREAAAWLSARGVAVPAGEV
jgi:2-methylcitrate dehydratase PrpD